MDIQKMIDSYANWIKERITFEKVNEYYEITTPYLDRFDDFLQIYVKQLKDGTIYMTDDGYIIGNLLSCGLSLRKNSNKFKILERIVNNYGLQLKGEEITTKAELNNFPLKKHLMVQAMLSVDNMFELRKENVKNLYLHLFTDGRDTLPRCAEEFFIQLNKKIEELNIGVISTISGRYYAMDRDNNFDRIKKTYDAMVFGEGKKYSNYKELLDDNYKNDINDEFIIPGVIDERGVVSSGDSIIVFNYRPDRLRELFMTLTNDSFDKFETKKLEDIKLVTMMPVSNDVKCTNAYNLPILKNTLGEYVSNLGIKQLRIEETEKFAHVTYFFDGGEEKKLKNCTQLLIPSPKVATYDMKPEMSAYEITDNLIKELPNYDLVILNYANGDMVGHTGDLTASIKAVETLDNCLDKLYKKIKELNGNLLIIADHGNCEYMEDEKGNKITSHTTSLVPCILCNKDYKIKDGDLCDVAPTILKIMNIEIPKEMTGKVLVEKI